MLDVSKETNVRFLREAVKYLQEQLLTETRKVLELTAAKAHDEELCTRLSDQLLVLRKRFFVGGREKVEPRSGMPKSAGGKPLPHNESPLSAPLHPAQELEAEEVVHTLGVTPCPTCKDEMAPMTGGFEEASEIHVTERKYVLRRHKRQKYVCRACDKIRTAPGPAKLTPGGEFSIHMGVQVADDKYNLHLPLNRQMQQMAAAGLKVSTKTLFSLTEHLAARLATVPDMIKAEILSRPYVSIDESPMKLLATNSRGFVWSIANNYGAFYQYETTRSGAVARELLRGYRGVVMCDGYKGYAPLEATSGITLVHCWAHCRRRFHDAMASYPESEACVRMIDELYEIERAAKSLEELANLRQGKSATVIERFDAYLASRHGRYLASGAFGKAVAYYTERRVQLTRFLSEVNAPIDSNNVERCLRDPVMGRKNFLGFRTINGADVGMAMYTIVKTCKVLGIAPKSYMLVMATRAAKGESVVTPYGWAAELTAKAEAGLSQHELFRELQQELH